MIRGFEFTVGLMSGIGFVMKSAVGEWAAEAFVKEKEQECHVEAFYGKAIGVASAIAL